MDLAALYELAETEASVSSKPVTLDSSQTQHTIAGSGTNHGAVAVTCVRCANRFEIPDSFRGTTATCHRCGQHNRVPGRLAQDVDGTQRSSSRSHSSFGGLANRILVLLIVAGLGGIGAYTAFTAYEHSRERSDLQWQPVDDELTKETAESLGEQAAESDIGNEDAREASNDLPAIAQTTSSDKSAVDYDDFPRVAQSLHERLKDSPPITTDEGTWITYARFAVSPVDVGHYWSEHGREGEYDLVKTDSVLAPVEGHLYTFCVTTAKFDSGSSHIQEVALLRIVMVPESGQWVLHEIEQKTMLLGSPTQTRRIRAEELRWEPISPYQGRLKNLVKERLTEVQNP